VWRVALAGGHPRVAPAVGVYRAGKELAAAAVVVSLGSLPERAVGAVLFGIWGLFDVLKGLHLRFPLLAFVVAKG